MSDFDRASAGLSEDQEGHPNVMSIRHHIALVLSCIVLALMGNGCSAVGYKLGTMIDEAGGNCSPLDASRLEPGTRKFFHLRDGTKLSGNYLGQDTVSATTYKETYFRAIANNDFTPQLPRPGERISVALNNGGNVSSEFSYFDYCDSQSPLKNTRISEAQKFVIALNPNSGSPMMQADFQAIDYIQLGDGKRTESKDLVGMALKGSIPLKSALKVSASNVEMTLPLQDIKTIKSAPRHCARWVGFGLGLTVDIGMIVGAIIVMSYDFEIDISEGFSGW